MEKSQKLSICDECPHMIVDGSNAIFDGERNDRYCLLLQSLIRPYLNSECPEGKW